MKVTIIRRFEVCTFFDNTHSNYRKELFSRYRKQQERGMRNPALAVLYLVFIEAILLKTISNWVRDDEVCVVLKP